MTKKTPKPAKAAKPESRPKPKVFVLFGSDEYAKPRGARFFDADPEVLAKAAVASSLRLFEVTSPDLAEIADRLPAGRMHATGRGLAPYIKEEIYLELVAETCGEQEVPKEPATIGPLPATWEDVAPGHLVIAKEAHQCGWWEAVVVDRNGDLVTLRYRDYPAYAQFLRHRSTVALIGGPAGKPAA